MESGLMMVAACNPYRRYVLDKIMCYILQQIIKFENLLDFMYNIVV